MTDPIRTKPPAPVNPSVMVNFFLKNGGRVEWPVPAGQPFAMGALVQGIRGAGFFVADDLYIPADEIACIGILTGGIPTGDKPRTKVIHQQPQHPTRQ